MIRSLLIGLVAGARSITPVAAVSEAARRHALPLDNGAPSWLGRPAVAGGLKLMAAGELGADKLPAAPNRIVPFSMAVRMVGAGVAGAALAPRRRALAGALLGAGAAVAATYVTFDLRRRAMLRFGQVPTGLVEDALALAATRLIVRGAR